MIYSKNKSGHLSGTTNSNELQAQEDLINSILATYPVLRERVCKTTGPNVQSGKASFQFNSELEPYFKGNKILSTNEDSARYEDSVASLERIPSADLKRFEDLLLEYKTESSKLGLVEAFDLNKKNCKNAKALVLRALNFPLDIVGLHNDMSSYIWLASDSRRYDRRKVLSDFSFMLELLMEFNVTKMFEFLEAFPGEPFNKYTMLDANEAEGFSVELMLLPGIGTEEGKLLAKTVVFTK